MADRQRLEAIVSVVCEYLPPDGISKDDALNKIIALVDPLPPAPLPVQEPVGVVQCVSISGYPMQDSRGVEWLCAVPVGSKLYTSPPQENT